MKSGSRKDLITLERNTGTSEDAAGATVESWAAYATAWANIEYGGAAEKHEAGAEGGQQHATFWVLAFTATLATTTADRISFNGIWDITGVAPWSRDTVRIRATKRTAA